MVSRNNDPFTWINHELKKGRVDISSFLADASELSPKWNDDQCDWAIRSAMG